MDVLEILEVLSGFLDQHMGSPPLSTQVQPEAKELPGKGEVKGLSIQQKYSGHFFGKLSLLLKIAI